MRRDLELAIGDAVTSLAAAGPQPATAPAVTVDTSVYTDPDLHRREVAAIAAAPAAALVASELAKGSFVTLELSGRPIIITRDHDGQVHAMLNVCAHRGATVERRASGSTRVFSCGFHAWSYRLDGSLRAVTDADLFSSESCTTGLRRLVCEERHGIIWVTADINAPASPVAEWMGADLDDYVAELGMDQMVHHAAIDYDLGCNWKLLTDGFLELYHLKYLHRDSIAPYFPGNLCVFREYGPHVVGYLPKNRLLKHLAETRRDEWQVMRGLTAPVILVPGTVIQWQAGHVELFSLRPDPADPTRTRARLSMMVPADQADNVELWDRNWERVKDTIPAEDFQAAVDVQGNINAGVLPRIQIGANEQMLLKHLDSVKSCLPSA